VSYWRIEIRGDLTADDEEDADTRVQAIIRAVETMADNVSATVTEVDDE